MNVLQTNKYIVELFEYICNFQNLMKTVREIWLEKLWNQYILEIISEICYYFDFILTQIVFQ